MQQRRGEQPPPLTRSQHQLGVDRQLWRPGGWSQRRREITGDIDFDPEDHGQKRDQAHGGHRDVGMSAARVDGQRIFRERGVCGQDCHRGRGSARRHAASAAQRRAVLEADLAATVHPRFADGSHSCL